MRCVCPKEGYVCRVSFGTEIEWIATDLGEDSLRYSLFNVDAEEFQKVENFEAYFEGVEANSELDNYTSTLFVSDIFGINGTTLTCVGEVYNRRSLVDSINDTISICVVGKQFSPACCMLMNPWYRPSLISHWSVSGVELLISSGQFPVSSVWRRVCGVLCGHCCW